jgi:hypothetical protein
MKYQLCTVLSMLYFLLSVHSARSEISVDEATDFWVSACENISSYDIILTTTHSTRNDDGNLEVVARYLARHRFQNQMWRVDHLALEDAKGAVETRETTALAWDREVIRVQHNDTATAAVVARAKFNKTTIGGPLYHELFFSTYSGEPYFRNIRTRGNASLAKQGSRYVITADPTPSFYVTWRTHRLNFELEPAANFLPAAFSVNKDDGFPLFEVANTIKEWQPGIWAPKHALWKIYSKQFGAQLAHSEITVEASDENARFNIPIDSDVFKLKVPLGFVVYDDREKRNYLAAAGGAADYEGYRKKIRDQLYKQRTDQARESAALVRLIVIVVGASFLGLLLLLVWHRRRMCRTTPQ